MHTDISERNEKEFDKMKKIFFKTIDSEQALEPIEINFDEDY